MTTTPETQRRPRHRSLWLAVPVCAAIAALVMYANASSSAAPASAPAVPVPVTLAKATQQDVPVWLDAIGTVTSLNAVNVRSRVDGQLERVVFKEGQTVKAGELLAEIDPRPLQAQVNQNSAALAQEQAKLGSMKVDLQRAIDLAGAGAGPAQTVDTLRAQVDAQAAAVQGASAALNNAQLQLGFTRITSPIDGRLGQRLVPAGSQVHASDVNPIATVTQMNPVWVSFSVPQDQLPFILVNSKAKPLTVEALLRDRSKSLAGGVLDFVDSQVAPAAGQIQLKARFDNAGQALWPGQLVAIRMLVHTQPGATVVPQEAVQQGPQGPFVYVVDAQHLAQARPVDVGTTTGSLQWIRKGLQPGDTVVAQGQYRVAPGVLVSNNTTQAQP